MTAAKIIGSLFIVFVLLSGGVWWYFSKQEITREARFETNDPLLIEISPKALLKQIKDSKIKVSLVNVWASWCAPCLQEIPLLLKLKDEFQNKDFQLILYSADRPQDREDAAHFLREQKVKLSSFIIDASPLNDIEILFPGWQGVLPVTVVFDSNGKVLHKWMGTASYSEFQSTIKNLLEN